MRKLFEKSVEFREAGCVVQVCVYGGGGIDGYKFKWYKTLPRNILERIFTDELHA